MNCAGPLALLALRPQMEVPGSCCQWAAIRFRGAPRQVGAFVRQVARFAAPEDGVALNVRLSGPHDSDHVVIRRHPDRMADASYIVRVSDVTRAPSGERQEDARDDACHRDDGDANHQGSEVRRHIQQLTEGQPSSARRSFAGGARITL